VLRFGLDPAVTIEQVSVDSEIIKIALLLLWFRSLHLSVFSDQAKMVWRWGTQVGKLFSAIKITSL